MINASGTVYTFYSFKGGTGRSMALANVAALLAKAGNSVLIIDWDLEAPGIEKYFEGFLSNDRRQADGILDIAYSYLSGKQAKWDNSLLYAKPFSDGKQVSILTAGRDDERYFERLQALDWEELFSNKGFGTYLEQLREEWKSKYDYILIDSRTGITDIGGVCTIHLPDILVFLFTANEQSVYGAKNVVRRIFERHRILPLDRARLLAIPLPSRFETISENNLSAKWKAIFSETFYNEYADWIPQSLSASDIVDKLCIPYVPFWSFGEGLPVVAEGISDPRSLGFAYNILARLLGFNLDWHKTIRGEIALTNEISPKALNDSLELFYQSLHPFEQEVLETVLLQFVFVDYNNEDNDTTKKVKLEGLQRWKSIIDLLLDKQILSKSFNSLTREPELELSDKTLIKDWKRLNAWIKEQREFLFWRQNLNAQAEEWENSGRDVNMLLDKKSLIKSKVILRKRRQELGDLEDLYIMKSERRIRFAIWARFILSAVLTVVIIAGGAFVYRLREFQAKSLDELMMANVLMKQRDSVLRSRYEYELRYSRMQLDSLNLLIRQLKTK